MSLAEELVVADFVPVPAPGVQTAYLDGEAVLYDVERHQPLLLNPTGSAAWMLLDGELSVRQLIDELSEIFDVPAEVIAEEVTAVVVRFGELGLLRGIEPLDIRDEHGARIPAGGALGAPPVP